MVVTNKKLKIEEGMLFCVPLRTKGYGVGLIARRNKNVLLGYFWNRIYLKVPSKVDLRDYLKENVVLVRQFGILGLKNGEWSIIGALPDFNPKLWEVPKFLRKTSENEKYIITYDEKLQFLEQKRVVSEEDVSLHLDGMSGYGALEKRLTAILDPQIEV